MDKPLAPTGPERWIDAAYARFAAAGLADVRIELIARDIGATKGSFYWHFANRKALVEAVVERWEAVETDQLIRLSETGATAQERLELLFAAVAARSATRAGERTLYIEAEREGVGDAVARVAERRIRYVADLLEESGIAPDEARRRGVIALASVLGIQQLAAGAGAEVLGDAAALTRSALAITLS